MRASVRREVELVSDDYGGVNTDYGEKPKVFMISQNERSRKTIIGVHDKSESAFTVCQNTHFNSCSLRPMAAKDARGEKCLLAVVGSPMMIVPPEV